jgi:Transposase IS66 family
MILVDKYANHQPLNRESDQFAREGVELSVSTMADHVGAYTAVLLPLYELVKAHVFAAERIHGDDTTVPVLAKVKTRTGGCGPTCVTIVSFSILSRMIRRRRSRDHIIGSDDDQDGALAPSRSPARPLAWGETRYASAGRIMVSPHIEKLADGLAAAAPNSERGHDSHHKFGCGKNRPHGTRRCGDRMGDTRRWHSSWRP